MIGANYMVRILPNDLILVINQSNKQRKVLKPKELGAYFENELKTQIKTWDNTDENLIIIQDELSKL